jgi:hypothetical protein
MPRLLHGKREVNGRRCDCEGIFGALFGIGMRFWMEEWSRSDLMSEVELLMTLCMMEI